MRADTRSVTLVDVARAAGVSRTTASAALSATGRVSATTRARVETIAEELGYVANSAARNLRGGRRGAIALYVPDRLAGYAFYMELAFGAAHAAHGSGSALTLVSPTPVRGVRPLLAHVDAFVVVDPLARDPFVEAVIRSGVPVVAAERVLEGAQPTVTIETDHQGAILALLDHLWEQGARAPALLGLDIPFAWARLVDDTYRGWCQAHDVAPCLRPFAAESGPNAVRDVARHLLTAKHPPDAIVGAPDGAALGVLSAARDVGRHVGDDLLVASCVDSLALQLTTPSVTAIDLRPREIGYDSAAVALRLVDGDRFPSMVRRDRPLLELRESTARSVMTSSTGLAGSAATDLALASTGPVTADPMIDDFG